MDLLLVQYVFVSNWLYLQLCISRVQLNIKNVKNTKKHNLCMHNLKLHQLKTNYRFKTAPTQWWDLESFKKISDECFKDAYLLIFYTPLLTGNTCFRNWKKCLVFIRKYSQSKFKAIVQKTHHLHTNLKLWKESYNPRAFVTYLCVNVVMSVCIRRLVRTTYKFVWGHFWICNLQNNCLIIFI